MSEFDQPQQPGPYPGQPIGGPRRPGPGMSSGWRYAVGGAAVAVIVAAIALAAVEMHNHSTSAATAARGTTTSTTPTTSAGSGASSSTTTSTPSTSVPAPTTVAPSTTATSTTSGAGSASGGGSAPSGGAVPSGFSPASVTFVSPSEGFVLGTAPCAGGGRCPVLLHTTNDESSWSTLGLPSGLGSGRAGSAGAPTKVRFADSNDGWIFAPLGAGGNAPLAWSTHDGGKSWSAVSFPGAPADNSGVEDLEAAHGVVHAAVEIGGDLYLYSSPISSEGWHRTSGDLPLGAGPVPAGQFVLQGNAGWFVQNDREVIGGAELQASGTWTPWSPPCLHQGGPVTLAAPTPTQVDALCVEGVWSGPSVREVSEVSTNSGTTFGPARSVPASDSVSQVAATGTATMVVAYETTGDTSRPALTASFDGGVTWQQVYAGQGNGWTELGFTTTSQGVAIVGGSPGAPAIMLRTTDGGHTWSAVSF
jgi:hypothetical protein